MMNQAEPTRSDGQLQNAPYRWVSCTYPAMRPLGKFGGAQRTCTKYLGSWYLACELPGDSLEVGIGPSISSCEQPVQRWACCVPTSTPVNHVDFQCCKCEEVLLGMIHLTC